MGTCVPLVSTFAVSLRALRVRRGSTHLLVDVLDVDKPCILHSLDLDSILDYGAATTHLLGALDEELAPLAVGAAGRDCAVVTLGVDCRLIALDPAARLADAIRVLEQGVPVGDAAEQVAHVHVVEGV